jgi:hypothetical protein
MGINTVRLIVGSQKEEQANSMLLPRHYSNGGWQHLFSSHLEGPPSRHLQDGSKISRRNTELETQDKTH